MTVAIDADYSRYQVRKEMTELLQRGVDDGTVLHALDGQHEYIVVGKAHDIRSTWKRNAAQHHLADLDLRRDGDIDGHIFTAEEVAIFRLEIALVTDAGDFGGNTEQRMRHFTGDNVDLVVERNGDDHISLIGTRFRQHIRVRAVADITAHIKRLSDRCDQGR